jgi:hypothetical protein
VVSQEVVTDINVLGARVLTGLLAIYTAQMDYMISTTNMKIYGIKQTIFSSKQLG